MTDETERRLIEEGVRKLILNPQCKGFQIALGHVWACTDKPRGKYGINGLGFQGSDLHASYRLSAVHYLNGKRQRLLIGELWERGDPVEGEPYYYSLDAQEQLIRDAKRVRAGKSPAKWPALPMVRIGGPSYIATIPEGYWLKVIRETVQKASEDMRLAHNSLNAL